MNSFEINYMRKPQFITKIDRKALISTAKFVGKLCKTNNRMMADDDDDDEIEHCNTVCIEVPMLFTFNSIYSTSCLLYIE